MDARKILRAALTMAMVMAMASIAAAGPSEVPAGTKCHLCGMGVDPGSPFSAQAVERGSRVFFCDIGDLLHYYKKVGGEVEELYVRDLDTNQWVDARAASYVRDESLKTPMGWNLAAFAGREEAEKRGSAMTFSEALDALQ